MLNQVVLQGRITDHPELKHTNFGKAVTSFSIAVEDSIPINGERKVNFFKIEVWNAVAEFVCKYFEKGQQIIIDGRLTTNTYTDKNYNKRKDVYIVADSINFCGAKSFEAQEKDTEATFFENSETESIE